MTPKKIENYFYISIQPQSNQNPSQNPTKIKKCLAVFAQIAEIQAIQSIIVLTK